MMLVKLVALCSLIPAVFSTLGISLSNLLPFGTSAGDTTTNIHNRFQEAGLLDFYNQVVVQNGLPSFKIFGVDLGRNIFINYNGHLTFGARHESFDPFTVNNTAATVSAIFNVYYSDNDLRRPDGLLHHRISTSSSDLSTANGIIRAQGFTTFTASYCVIATWEKVKYYVSDAAQRGNAAFQQQNTYQIILCTDGNDGHAIYQYYDMQWTRSQDTTTNYATIGWMVKQAANNLRFWAPAPSGTVNAYQDMALGSNVAFKGRWMRSQEIVGPCVGQADGMYSINCNQYRECCGQKVQRETSCPTGTAFHPTLKICTEAKIYNCEANHFCATRSNGAYANTLTSRVDDFYRCRSGTGRVLLCPYGAVFGTARCST